MEVDQDIHRITTGINMVIPVLSRHTHRHGDLLEQLALILQLIREAILPAITVTMVAAWVGNITKAP